MARESMEVLPGIMQPFLSWLTAKPLRSQLDTVSRKTPLFHVATTLGILAVGTFFLAYGYSISSVSWWLLGFVISTSGIKQMQVMICHNCAHNMVFTGRRANLLAGHVISSLLILKPFDVYKREHLLHHDHKTLLTDDDDTLSFLSGVVGLSPRDSVGEMWFKLVRHALSPIKIVISSVERVLVNVQAENTFAAIVTSLFWFTILTGAYYFGVLGYVIAAWLIPVFVGYHISTTFRLAAEHTWPSVEVLNRRGIDFVAEATTGVFIGERLDIPEDANVIVKALCMVAWLFKMLTFHLFVRVFVMVGDTPCHDFHHRRPKSKEWPNYITARERDLIGGSKPYPSNYVDYWGYVSAVTENFRNYQAAHDYYEYSPKSRQGAKS